MYSKCAAILYFAKVTSLFGSQIKRVGHLYSNILSHAAYGIQKNLGLMSSSRKLRNSQEKAKADAAPLKDKSSSCIFRGNDVSFSSSLRSIFF